MAFKSLEEQREYMREWRARNPDYQKKHYAKNLDKRRAEKRASYEADPDKWKGRAKQYRKQNPDRYREQKRQYRTENAAKENARIKKWNRENPDRADIQNAKRILHEQTGMAIRDIPADLAAAKAEQVQITRWVREQLAAQVDRNPKGHDAEERHGAKHESPVANGDAPQVQPQGGDA